MTDRSCKWCLGPMTGANPRQVFCSQPCRARHASRRRYGDADGYGATLAAAACCRCGVTLSDQEVRQGRNSKRLCDLCKSPAEHPCPRCGVMHRGDRPSCSPACSAELRRAHYRDKTRRRKDVERSAPTPLDRLEVFASCGWVCSLCSEHVDPALEWPDLRSASIDHIIPIAAGGLHVRENVQLAHLACNIAKSDRL